MVKCHLPRSVKKGVRRHEPSWYSSVSPALHFLLYHMLFEPKQGQERTDTEGGSRRGRHKGARGRGDPRAVVEKARAPSLVSKNSCGCGGYPVLRKEQALRSVPCQSWLVTSLATAACTLSKEEKAIPSSSLKEEPGQP